MTNMKITKREYFGLLKTVVAESGSDDDLREMLFDFIDHEVELLNSKAEKAAARAAAKKEQGDALYAEVADLLTDEFQTIDQIVEQVEDLEATKAKVTARLTKMVKNGIAVKEVVRGEDKRRLTAYKLTPNEEDIENAENVGDVEE